MNQSSETNPATAHAEQPQPTQADRKSNKVTDWIIRLLKGVLIGVGFITPGLSGGVLAVVLGLYEPLMRFLANLKNKFIKNILFFIPVGIGGVIGIVLFSKVVSFAFESYKAPFIWLFLGFIAGTFPSLFKTAGEGGRKTSHWFILVGLAVATVLFMHWMENVSNVTLSQTTLNWLLSGILIGLGVVVPGMSPSNFLIYLGLYKPMSDGIGALNLGVILPLVAGVFISILLLARLVAWMLEKAHGVMYHLILGIVIGSTVAIALTHGQTSGMTILICAVLFVLGAVASYLLAKLDEKHPREALF